jgi:hypothetical protein
MPIVIMAGTEDRVVDVERQAVQEEIDGSSYCNLSRARRSMGAFIETSTTARGCIRPGIIARPTSTKPLYGYLRG